MPPTAPLVDRVRDILGHSSRWHYRGCRGGRPGRGTLGSRGQWYSREAFELAGEAPSATSASKDEAGRSFVNAQRWPISGDRRDAKELWSSRHSRSAAADRILPPTALEGSSDLQGEACAGKPERQCFRVGTLRSMVPLPGSSSSGLAPHPHSHELNIAAAMYEAIERGEMERVKMLVVM